MEKWVAQMTPEYKDGEILLLRRVRGDHVQWEIPGGKVEPGEDPGQAAIREAKEELGVDVTLGSKIGQASFEFDGQQWLYHWFGASVISGEPQIMEPAKFDDLRYFSDAQMQANSSEMSLNIKNYLKFIQSTA